MRRLLMLITLPAAIILYALIHTNRAPRRPYVAGPWWARL